MILSDREREREREAPDPPPPETREGREDWRPGDLTLELRTRVRPDEVLRKREKREEA